MDYYIYKHYTKDENKLFYIGLGKNKRAYNTLGRNKLWTAIYKKHGRIVEIVKNNLSLDEANFIEAELIKKYGKIIDGSGILSNIGDGGETIWNRNKSKEEQPRYGKKNSENQKKIVSDLMKKNNPMLNQDTKNKMIETKKGVPWKSNHKRLREIEVFYNDELIGTYLGIKEVSRELLLNYNSIQKVLYNLRKSLHGYKIKYKI